MRKWIRYSLRILVIVAVVASLSPLFVPAAPLASPYASALDPGTIPPPTPASCNNSGCSRSGTCVSRYEYNCFLLDHGVCQQNHC